MLIKNDFSFRIAKLEIIRSKKKLNNDQIGTKIIRRPMLNGIKLLCFVTIYKILFVLIQTKVIAEILVQKQNTGCFRSTVHFSTSSFSIDKRLYYVILFFLINYGKTRFSFPGVAGKYLRYKQNRS